MPYAQPPMMPDGEMTIRMSTWAREYFGAVLIVYGVGHRSLQVWVRHHGADCGNDGAQAQHQQILAAQTPV